jgi:CBS domain-containing protein
LAVDLTIDPWPSQIMRIQSNRAGDLMLGDLATVSEETDLIAVLSAMREHGVRRLPVVDTNDAMAGIVSADDLMGLMASVSAAQQG